MVAVNKQAAFLNKTFCDSEFYEILFETVNLYAWYRHMHDVHTINRQTDNYRYS